MINKLIKPTPRQEEKLQKGIRKAEVGEGPSKVVKKSRLTMKY